MTYITKPKFHHPALPKNALGFTHRDYEGSVSTLCAGCGHDSISAAIIQACWELDIEPHRVAKLSGIGCSSKTPDYFLGQSLDRLRVRAFPFHSSVTSFVADHDFVFVVEQNRDGQLRSLIVNECGIDPIRLVPILHYDGTPITARFIAGAIGEHLDAFKVTPLRVARNQTKA